MPQESTLLTSRQQHLDNWGNSQLDNSIIEYDNRSKSNDLIEHGEISDQAVGRVDEGRWFVELIKEVTDPSKEVPTQLYKTGYR